ncbi:MAG TPA: hypothetical protein VF975_01365, partial [Thermoanaerobaculia bacterium]
MNLGIDDFHYADLYDYARLRDLATSFDRFVENRDAQLFSRFESYRVAMQSGIAHGGLTEPQEADLLISASRHLSSFLARLFRTDPTPVKSRTERDAKVARFKKEFVSKRVAKVVAPAAMAVAPPPSAAMAGEDAGPTAIIQILSGERDHDHEYAFALTANRLLDLER